MGDRPEFTFGTFLRPPGTNPIRIKQLPLHPLSYYGVPKRKLGAGTYGGVTAFCANPCVQEVAVKSAINERGETTRDGAIDWSLLHEVIALIRVDHPNIVNLIDVSVYDTTFALILPVATTSLKDYGAIENGGKRDLRLSSDDIGQVCYQILRALLYLESVDVWHRDLKPANVLLYDDTCKLVERGKRVFRVVISDLGLSRVGMCAHSAESILAGAGTPLYLAPEILLGGRYMPVSEVWALGCIVYELATRRVIFPGGTLSSIAEMAFGALGVPSTTQWPQMRLLPGWKPQYEGIVRRGGRQAPFPEVDETLRPILLRTLVVSPLLRSTARQLIHDKIIERYRGSVESCIPAPESAIVGCETEVREEAQLVEIPRPPPRMALGTRSYLVQRLEDVLGIVAGSSFRAFFLALGIVDQYMGLANSASMEELLLVAVHLSRNLVDETQPVRVEMLVDKPQEEAFSQLELRVLSVLRFNVHLTTAFDVLESLRAHYAQPTYDTALLLLRAAIRGTLVYSSTQEELAVLCVAMAASVTLETFRHGRTITPERMRELLTTFFRDVAHLLGTNARTRLASASDTLESLLGRMPLAHAFIR